MIVRTSMLLLGLTLGALCLPGCEREQTTPEPPQEGRAEPRGRVLLIGIDGASPLLVDPLMAAGRLPHLASLAERGVHGTIKSFKPISSPLIWNTIVTGKMPAKHGILNFSHPGEKNEGKARNVLYLSTDRKVHALWNIVSDAGMRVGVVNFWNTYPPELVDGVMVSDHLMARSIEGRRQLTHSAKVPPGAVVHPESWHARLADLLAERDPLTPFANPLRRNPDLPHYLALAGDNLPRRFEEDGWLTRIALEIDEAVQPDLLMLLLPGIDRVSHFLWGSLQDDQSIYAEELRQSESERRAGRRAVELYYQYTDALIGRLLEGFGDDDLVIVLSDHGIEPGRRMGLLTGLHEGDDALDGVFFAAGHGIEPGSETQELSVRDVTPTVLAWLDLAIGDDMDGAVASFLADTEVARVATHDTTPVPRMSLRPSGVEAEIVDQLRSLGYLE